MSEFWKNFKRGFVDSASKISSGVSGLPFRFLDNAFMRSNMRYQQDLTHETMRYQSHLNQQAIDRQNEYNDPRRVAHRARLAGLDPSVLLGGSAGSPGISGSSDGVSMSAPSASHGSSSDFFSRAFTGQQLKNMESQQALTDAQAGAAKAQAEKDTAQAENIRQQTDDIRWYNQNVRQLDVLLKQAGLTKSQADARIAELEKLYQEYISAEGDIEKSQRFDMFKAELDKTRAEIGELEASASLKSEQVNTEISQQNLNTEKQQTENSIQALNALEKKHRSKYNDLLLEAQKIRNVSDLANAVVTLTTGMPLGSSCWQWLGALANRVSFNNKANDSLKRLIDSLGARLDNRAPKDLVDIIKNTTSPEQFADALRKLNLDN